MVSLKDSLHVASLFGWRLQLKEKDGSAMFMLVRDACPGGYSGVELTVSWNLTGHCDERIVVGLGKP